MKTMSSRYIIIITTHNNLDFRKIEFTTLESIAIFDKEEIEHFGIGAIRELQYKTKVKKEDYQLLNEYKIEGISESIEKVIKETTKALVDLEFERNNIKEALEKGKNKEVVPGYIEMIKKYEKEKQNESI